MNNIETIAKSATSSQAVSYDPSETEVSLFDCFALYLGILVLIACLAVCFAAAKAHAQDLPTQDGAQVSTVTNGWWSLECGASATSALPAQQRWPAKFSSLRFAQVFDGSLRRHFSGRS
jgi:hypothetical protein